MGGIADKKIGKVMVEKIWLTIPQLTEYLGFANRATQQEWRESGALPYYRIGKNIVYKKSEVDEFVEKHKQYSI
jgi:excisionase family DNA binding protein